MSLDINQIALHQLIKRDEQNLELVLRDSLLEPTETVVEMVTGWCLETQSCTSVCPYHAGQRYRGKLSRAVYGAGAAPGGL